MADELDLIFQQAHGGAATGGGSSAPDELDTIFQAAHSGLAASLPQAPSYAHTLVDAIKQFGSGAIEGTAGLAGLVADLNPLNLASGNPSLDFRNSTLIKSYTDEITAAPDPTSSLNEWSRTLGSFVGPTGAMGAVGKGLGLAGKAGPAVDWLASQLGRKALVSAGTAGVGAQAAEDLTGNDTIAPLVGAVIGGAAPSVFSSAWDAGRSLFRGATPQEVVGSSALALKDVTGLTPQDLKAAISARPKDALGQLMTTAEVTDNAGMAQIEKTLASANRNADLYAGRDAARSAVRENLLSGMSNTAAVNVEGLNGGLISKASSVKDSMKDAENWFWKSVPRDVPINAAPYKGNLMDIVGSRQAGLPLTSKTRTLVEQFIKEGPISSGALQDIRSDALALSRDANLTGHEKRILANLQSSINNAMENGLKGEYYQTWKDARGATAAEKAVFEPGTAGGYLTGPQARDSNALQKVFKGDTLSVKEIKNAIASEPQLIEDMKRGVLDFIPRDQFDKIRPAAMKTFIKANGDGLTELLGKKHFANLERITEDLNIQAGVRQLADLASKGGSATAQRMTVAGALDSLITDSITPAKGVFGRVVNAFKESTGLRDKKSVSDLLFRAALEPEFALELSQAPTSTRILNAFETMKRAGNRALLAGSRGAALQMGSASRSDERSTQAPRQSSATAIPLPPWKSRQSSGLNSSSPTESGKAARTLEPSILQPTPGGPQPGPRSNTEGQQLSRSGSPSPQNTPTAAPIQSPFDVLLDAVKHVESRGDTNAVSKAGAQGAYQIMPETGKEYHRKLGIQEPYNPFDEQQARLIAAAILQDYAGQLGGDFSKAVTAYHSGVKNVRDGKLGPEGKKYLPSVAQVFEKLMQNASTGKA